MSSYQVVANDSTESLMDSWGILGVPVNSRMFAYLIAAALFGIVLYSRPTTKSNVSLLNPRHWYEWTDNRAKQYFIKNSKTMIEDQFAKTPDRPFRVISDTGVATVLPPCLAHEIRNDPRFSLSQLRIALMQCSRRLQVISPALRDSATRFTITL